jgi:hypothetical protein
MGLKDKTGVIAGDYSGSRLATARLLIADITEVTTAGLGKKTFDDAAANLDANNLWQRRNVHE